MSGVVGGTGVLSAPGCRALRRLRRAPSGTIARTECGTRSAARRAPEAGRPRPCGARRRRRSAAGPASWSARRPRPRRTSRRRRRAAGRRRVRLGGVAALVGEPVERLPRLLGEVAQRARAPATSSQVMVTRRSEGSMNLWTCAMSLAIAVLTADRSKASPSANTGWVQSASRSSYRTKRRCSPRVARSVCSIMLTQAAVRVTSPWRWS